MLPLDVNAASVARWGVVKRVPLGPVLAITPFNFPLNLTAHKVAPAIAVGAPVVQKPASQTPLSALALQAIVREAGWPADAYAVLPISGRDAEALVLDPRLPVVSFTGSGAVGWRLREIAPRKRVGLELGGNAAAVVHSDADLDDAASRVAAGAFGYAGQSCISVQRALVQRDVFDAFREKLLAKTAALAVGDPLDEGTDVGPMIAPEEAARAAAWIDEAVAGGAHVLAGASRAGSVVAPDDPRRHDARHEGRGAGGLRARRHARGLRHVGGGAPARERLAVRPAGRRSSRRTLRASSAPSTSSRSARSS